MSEAVNINDIQKGDPFLVIADQIAKATKELKEYDEELKSIAKTYQSQLAKAEKLNIENLEKINTLNQKSEKLIKEKQQNTKTLTEVEKEQLRLQKAILKERAAVAQATSKENKELLKLRAEKNRINKATRDEIKENERSKNAYLKLTDQTNKAQANFKRLAAQYGVNSRQAKQARNDFERLDNELREINNSARDGRRDVGRYGIALQGLRSTALKVTGVLGAGLGFRELIGLTNEQDQINKRLTNSFGLQGQELANTRKQVQFLAQAYDKEVNQVIETANVLTKQFGVNQQQAFELLDKGFERGADVRGEFLEQLNEYATQFVNVGLSAEEAIAVITQQEQAGVFSDKGIDAIKEAGIRLTELPKSANDALKGIKISGLELQRQIVSGEKTVFEATQEISREIAKLPPNSREVGVVLADVFGGAGEDAKGFVLELGNVSTNLDELEVQTTEYEQAKQDLILKFIEIKDQIAQGLVPVLKFLAQNLGTIIGATVRLGALYLVYANRVKVANAANFLFNGGLSKMLRSIPRAIKSLRGMSLSVRSLGSAMKAIPFVAIVSGLIELVSWLWQSKDATDANTEAEEKLNNELERGNELRKERIKTGRDIDTQVENRNKLSQQELKLLKQKLESEISFGEQASLNLKTERERLKQQRISNIQNQLAQGIDTGDPIKDLEKQRDLEIELLNLQNERGRFIPTTGSGREGEFSLEEENTLLSKRQKQLELIIPLIKTTTSFTRTGGELAEKTLSEQINLLDELNRLHRERLDLEQEESQANREEQIDILDSLIEKEKELQSAQAQQGAFDITALNGFLGERISLQIQNINDESEFEINKLEDTLKIKQKKRREELKQRVENGKALQADLDKLDQIELAELEVLETEKQNILNQAARDRAKLERENSEELLDIQKELNDAVIEQEKLAEEERKRLAEEELARRKEAQDKLFDIVNAAQRNLTRIIEEQTDRRINALQKELDAQRTLRNQLTQLAAEGNIDAQQSIKATIEAERQKEAEIARLEERKQRIQLISQGLETYLTLVEDGESPGSAFAQTVITTQGLISFLSGLQGFWTGTENAPEGLAWTQEKGQEIITDKHGNIKSLGSDGGAQLTYLQQGDKVKNASETANIFRAFNELDNLRSIPKQDISGNSYDLLAMGSKLDRIEQAIKNQPYSITDWENITRGLSAVTSTTIKGGDKVVNRHYVRR